MESTTTYHHYKTHLQLFNVLPHGYMDLITTYHECRIDLQLYNVLYHRYMESTTIIIHVEQIYSYTTFYIMYKWIVLQPIITVEQT